MKKQDRKRAPKGFLESAAEPVISEPSGGASAEELKAQAREGGAPGPDKFPGIGDLAGLIGPKRKRVMISIRLDPDVLSWYRSIGKGYQSYIGELLAAWKKQQESCAQTRATDLPRAGTRPRKRTAKATDEQSAGKEAG